MGIWAWIILLLAAGGLATVVQFLFFSRGRRSTDYDWVYLAAGALIGGFVGHKMDNNDKQKATQAAQQAFEQNQAGQPSVWNNPQTGNSGSITPTKTYQLANGQYCRQYQQTITIGGEQHQTYGTACRQADGNWQIQNS